MPNKIAAALGTKLKIGTTAMVGLTSIGGVEVSADTIEVTTLDAVDGYREFIGGLKDGGEVALSGFLDVEDTTGQLALLTALDTGAVTALEIVFPSTIGFSWKFNGIITNFATGAELEDAVTFEGNIKVTGKPTLAATVA